jgi:hypothetical protein
MVKFSEKQMVNIKYFEDLKAVEEWLDSFVEISDPDGAQPYYSHLDHVQILPVNEHGRYPVLTIHRTVYLQKG